MRDDYNYDGSTTNECVNGILGAPPPQEWKGNLIVMKLPKKGINSRLLDIGMEDLDAVVEWFRWFGLGLDNRPQIWSFNGTSYEHKIFDRE